MLVTVLALGMHLTRRAHGCPFLQEPAPVVGVLLLRLSRVFIPVFVAMLVTMLVTVFVATMQCRLNQLVVFVMHCVHSKRLLESSTARQKLAIDTYVTAQEKKQVFGAASVRVPTMYKEFASG
jgi:hypothetical protein